MDRCDCWRGSFHRSDLLLIFSGCTDTFFVPEKWAAARDFFAKSDYFYYPPDFRTPMFDHSAISRLVASGVVNAAGERVR